MTEKKYNYGLVFSGGAARGFAHLGAIKAIEERGIFAEILAGTSAGSIVGAFYADGFFPDEILEVFSRYKLLHLFDLSLPKKGFLKTTPLQRILKQNLRTKKLEDLQKPLYICITDLNNGCPVYVSEGDIVSSVIASCSIPVVFEAAVIGHTSYVDGGVLNNLPIEAIRHLCRKVIALNVNPIGFQKEINGVVGVLVRSFLLVASKEIANKKHLADIYIEMDKMSKFHYHEINKGKEMFKIGYEAVKNCLDFK